MNIPFNNSLSEKLPQASAIQRREAKQAELEKYFDLKSKDSIPNPSVSLDPSPTSSTTLRTSKSFQEHLSKASIQKEIQEEPQKKKLYDAALEFQSLFIDQMLNSMRKNLHPEKNLLYGGFRQKLFDDMLYEEYSRMLSRTDSFGIAEDIYRQFRPSSR